jgi:NAD(P)-dependent dehydrogenase (short-subunit alcohol dehydrogenase family)
MDVDSRAGEETISLVTARECDGFFRMGDSSVASDVESAVAEVVRVYGRLDFAHNNAGIAGAMATSPAEYPEELFDRVLAINLKGIWLCMKYEIPAMLAHNGGSIVNTSSVLGLVGAASPSSPAYVASKHGVIGLTKSFALSYASEGIRVNAVCPAYVDTPMVRSLIDRGLRAEEQLVTRHPIGRLGSADEIAEVVVWLCSDAASLVTGHAMVADGGYTAQ